MGYNAGDGGKNPQFNFLGDTSQQPQAGQGQAPSTNFADLLTKLRQNQGDGAQAQGQGDFSDAGMGQGQPEQSQLLNAIRAHRRRGGPQQAQGTQQGAPVGPGQIRGGGYGGPQMPQGQGGWRGSYGAQGGGGQQQFYAPGQPNPNQVRGNPQAQPQQQQQPYSPYGYSV